MSRPSIRPVIKAFLDRKSKKVSNTSTDGNNLYLFGNLIAYRDKMGFLWITSAGYRTVTTKDRLNGLPGVSIYQKKGTWYLNGQVWGGNWKKITTPIETYIDKTKELCGILS